MKNIFIRTNSKYDASGYSDYISRKDKSKENAQELVHYKSCMKNSWKDISEFEHSHNLARGRVRESREVMIAIPNKALDDKETLIMMADDLAKAVVLEPDNRDYEWALHLSQKGGQKNLHLHIHFTERAREEKKNELKEREPKIWKQDRLVNPETGRICKRDDPKAVQIHWKGQQAFKLIDKAKGYEDESNREYQWVEPKVELLTSKDRIFNQYKKYPELIKEKASEIMLDYGYQLGVAHQRDDERLKSKEINRNLLNTPEHKLSEKGRIIKEMKLKYNEVVQEYNKLVDIEHNNYVFKDNVALQQKTEIKEISDNLDKKYYELADMRGRKGKAQKEANKSVFKKDTKRDQLSWGQISKMVKTKLKDIEQYVKKFMERWEENKLLTFDGFKPYQEEIKTARGYETKTMDRRALIEPERLVIDRTGITREPEVISKPRTAMELQQAMDNRSKGMTVPHTLWDREHLEQYRETDERDHTHHLDREITRAQEQREHHTERDYDHQHQGPELDR